MQVALALLVWWSRRAQTGTSRGMWIRTLLGIVNLIRWILVAPILRILRPDMEPLVIGLDEKPGSARPADQGRRTI